MINQQVKIIFRFSFLFFLQSSSVFAATYYLSPTGSDTNNGSAGAPLATIMMAQSIAASGDTVIINAGTYTVPVSISLVSGVWAIVNNINKNGITYQAAPGTRPVFDFSGVTDPGLRIVAFWVTATGVTFQGFDVIGVRETITGVNNQSVGMFGWGSKNCTWNQVHVHDGECVGFYFQKVSSNNLVYQCDSYNNAGIDSFSYGNADGFGCHPSPGGTGNVFREDRAWNNSDDGYDCINSSEVVVFDHCWSYKNGNNGGNGNGFKVGGQGGTAQNAIPNPLPVHTVEYCLSACNSSHGFYANHQPVQAAVWTYNTSYGNGSADFDMLERTPPDYTSTLAQTNANDIAGVNEVMHFNLAFVGTLTADLNETGAIVSNNSWTNGIAVVAADFESTACAAMTQARNPDNSLPNITFMVPVCGSPVSGLGCFPAAACAGTNTPTATVTRTNTPGNTSTMTFTPTPTATRTNTSTNTNTPTSTNSFTFTVTATRTSSNTPTSTNSPANTFTASSTPTFTASRTNTFTNTNTPTTVSTNTFTAAATFTPTSTSTLTFTPTSTNSFSPTVTDSPTMTSTPTDTFTGTVSLTNTPTHTSTPTQTFTSINTQTNSSTSTPTSTSTRTFTPANTSTSTNSVTSTATRTSTPTASSTATPTQTSSFSSTPTATSTLTPTSTRTFTFTNTPTSTNSATPTPTSTPTFTPTSVTVSVITGPSAPPNSTQLPGAANVGIVQVRLNNPSGKAVTVTNLTLQDSGTPSTGITGITLLNNGAFLGTTTFSGTTAAFSGVNIVIPPGGSVTLQVNGNFSTTPPNGTYQLSLTGMAGTNGQPVNFTGVPYTGATVTIATATLTPTSSPTVTATATPQATIIVYPNPVTRPGPVTLQFTLAEPANRVEVLVFTLAFRKVNEIVLSNVSAGTTDVALPLTDKEGRPLANGLYYVVVRTSQGRFITKLLILR